MEVIGRLISLKRTSHGALVRRISLEGLRKNHSFDKNCLRNTKVFFILKKFSHQLFFCLAILLINELLAFQIVHCSELGHFDT